jgi:hypothetical protein
MRFYAAWYVGAGLVLLRAAPRPETATTVVRAVAALLLLAAVARVVSVVVEGWPHWSQVVLMVLEFVIPAVVVPWQAVVARRAVAPTSAGRHGGGA